MRRLQGPIVLLIGVLTMHWLCYLPTAGAGESGVHAAHAYLIGATPSAIAIAISVLLASLLAPLVDAKRGSRTVDVERQAARYAAVLVAAFLAQELAEVLLAPGGLDAMASPASWFVLPLAFALARRGPPLAV